MRSIAIIGAVVCFVACGDSADGERDVGATETKGVSETENDVEDVTASEVEDVTANEVEDVTASEVEDVSDVETAGAELAVVAILARSDIGPREAPIFCLYDGDTLDPRAPGVVGAVAVCPLAAADFQPADVDPRVVATDIASADGGTMPERLGWGMRVVFDAALDVATVETETCAAGSCVRSLADDVAQLTCGDASTPVALTGRYAADGTNTTIPPGPAIVLAPDPSALTFPTGTSCTLALLDGIADVHGRHVAADQRVFTVRMEDLAPLEIDPGLDGKTTPSVIGNANIVFAFNASLDDDSVDGSDFDLGGADGTSVVGTTQAHGASTPISVQLRFIDDWAVDRDAEVVELNDGAYVRATPYLTPGSYVARLAPGAEIKERHGGALTATEGALSQAFTVGYGLISTVPLNGAGTSDSGPPGPAASANLQLRFGGALDPSSVATGDFELSDGSAALVPFTVSVGTGANDDRVIIDPSSDLVPGVTYTFTILAGAAFDWAGTCSSSADAGCKTKTFIEARVISFRVM